MTRLSRFLSCCTLAGLVVSIGTGCGSTGGSASQQDVTLKFWNVFDNDDAFDDIINGYKALHPNVDIEYTKLRSDEYEDDLIHALAEGTGPDIFSVHNDEIEEYKNLLLPMPATTTVTYLEEQGTLRKQVVVVEKQSTTMSQKTLKQNFVDVVASDVIRPYQPDPDVDAEDRVFGLPLSVDTLALFYNKDLLNAAGIAEPPTDWETFHDDVVKLTSIDSSGVIKQSGAALGTSKNVERASDILSVLMMQNGTDMTDDRGRIAFHTVPEGTPKDIFPGLDAATFYTDYANPTKDAYTWNNTFPNSLEAFENGQTAMFLGYSYDIPLIQSAAPKLSFAVSTLPQIAGGKQVNYANYWVEGVSKDTKYSDWAWDFILYMTNKDHVKSYLDATQKPTALRNLINEQLDSESLGPFAEQLLTAESWYHGNDASAMEKAMDGFIDTMLAGTDDPEGAIQDTARVVQQTFE